MVNKLAYARSSPLFATATQVVGGRSKRSSYPGTALLPDHRPTDVSTD